MGVLVSYGSFTVISLMTNSVEYLFMYISDICTVFDEILKLLAHLFEYFFTAVLWEFFMYFSYQSFVRYVFANIFF